MCRYSLFACHYEQNWFISISAKCTKVAKYAIKMSHYNLGVLLMYVTRSKYYIIQKFKSKMLTHEFQICI